MSKYSEPIESVPAEPKVKYDFSRVEKDIFSVDGMQQSRDEAGQVTDGYVYRWGNVSSGNEIRHEKLNAAYWEKVDDADTSAPGGGTDDGGFVNLKRYGEEYKLYKRPVEAHEAHREYKQSKRKLTVENENTTKGVPHGAKQVWSMKPDRPFGRPRKVKTMK